MGNVASVNNLEWPAEDFCGTHLNPGQEIYYDPEEPKKLYVKYDRGFALFEAEENAETENTGTLGTGVSEHQGTENPSAGESEDDGAGKTIQAESEAGLLPGVTMEIMDVTETGITVSLVNHTELNMEFGEEYSLEDLGRAQAGRRFHMKMASGPFTVLPIPCRKTSRWSGRQTGKRFTGHWNRGSTGW